MYKKLYFLFFVIKYSICSAYGSSNQEIVDRHCGWMNNHTQHNSIQYNVYEPVPARKGYENPSQGTMYKSQQFGDTTYHTAYPSSPRKGFSN